MSLGVTNTRAHEREKREACARVGEGAHACEGAHSQGPLKVKRRRLQPAHVPAYARSRVCARGARPRACGCAV
eukprot:5550115-Pleurochrysis_carterae.AAC.9